MPGDAEIREINNACVVLSLPNRQRVYDVAAALKFAEKKPDKAVGMDLADDGDNDRRITKKD